MLSFLALIHLNRSICNPNIRDSGFYYSALPYMYADHAFNHVVKPHIDFLPFTSITFDCMVALWLS